MDAITRNARLAIVLVTCIAITGCNIDAAPIAEKQNPAERLPAGWYEGERPLLRVQVDAARNRLWALTWNGVELYDAKTRKKLAQVALPGWIWIGESYSCAPDLVVGPGGEAVVSSNAVSTLWRIDPVTLAASKHDLILDDMGRDVGFTGLAYSAEQGAFFAVSASHGSLWRIDPLFRRAQNISLSAPVRKACRVAIQARAADRRASRLVELCVRGDRGDSIVSLAPSQRSGYVSSRSCAA